MVDRRAPSRRRRITARVPTRISHDVWQFRFADRLGLPYPPAGNTNVFGFGERGLRRQLGRWEMSTGTRMEVDGPREVPAGSNTRKGLVGFVPSRCDSQKRGTMG